MHSAKRSTKSLHPPGEEGAAQVTTVRRTVTLDRCDAAVTSGTTSLKGRGGGISGPSWSLLYRLLKFSNDNTSKTDHLHQSSSFASQFPTPIPPATSFTEHDNMACACNHILTSSDDKMCLNCVRVHQKLQAKSNTQLCLVV